MLASDDSVKQAAAHLSRHDPVLAPVITASPLCSIRPHRDYYRELVQSIIGQQLSVKAAATIEARFVALFDGNFPGPEQILGMDVDRLRSVGFSRPKAAYVLDLAQHVVDGRVKFDHLDALSNEEVIKELTDVKGIGEWTAQMFLMFCMGRLDVLPVGDLGIKNGTRQLYGLDHSPAPEEIKAIAAKYNWHPYESVAAWYVWQSLDNAPKL